MATKTVEDLSLMTVEDIKDLTSVKCITAAFENGTYGRKVSLAEFKELSKEDRDALAEMIRPVIVEVAKL